MLDSRLAWLSQADNARLLRGGLRGIEKETLRVDSRGRLSERLHPSALGSALTHPYLTTDYSEALLEFVTPPFATDTEALEFLKDLHAFVYQNLDGELLWPPSMPCVTNADENVPIAQYGPSNEGRLRTIYRRGLGARYGRAMQAIAGAHFNYSPPTELWPALQSQFPSGVAAAELKSEALMGLLRNYRRHAWLVVYLFGASPAFCKSFRPAGHPQLEDLDGHTWYAPHGTSLRMSDLGYRNSTQARLSISANSLGDYVAELRAAVSTPDPGYEAIGVMKNGDYQQLNANILQIENEYYSSIRPKTGRTDLRPVAALERYGVEYVEVRTLDLDPEAPVGLTRGQMQLLETFLAYCLMADSPPISADEQREIDERELGVAWEGRRPGLQIVNGGRLVRLRDAGLALVAELSAVAEILDGEADGHARAVADAAAALEDAERLPSARLLRTLRDEGLSFFEYGRRAAERQQRYFSERGLAPRKRAELEEIAARSLEQAAAMESRPQPPFEAFLSRYLGG